MPINFLFQPATTSALAGTHGLAASSLGEWPAGGLPLTAVDASLTAGGSGGQPTEFQPLLASLSLALQQPGDAKPLVKEEELGLGQMPDDSVSVAMDITLVTAAGWPPGGNELPLAGQPLPASGLAMPLSGTPAMTPEGTATAGSAEDADLLVDVAIASGEVSQTMPLSPTRPAGEPGASALSSAEEGSMVAGLGFTVSGGPARATGQGPLLPTRRVETIAPSRTEAAMLGDPSAAKPLVNPAATAGVTAAVDTSGTFDLEQLVELAEGASDGGAAEAAPAGITPSRENPTRLYQTQVPATAQVQVPVGKPGWSEAVMEKVMWFSAQNIDSAEIQLSPPELGPMQVRVSTQNEQASVYFSSHHAAVRDALDQALPRLRELFESQGIQLLDAGVGERSFAEQRASRQFQQDGRQQGGEQDDGAAALAADESGGHIQRPRGMVDAYA